MTGCRIGKVTLKGGAQLTVLEGTKRPANPETVQYLEWALKMARAGNLQSIAIGAITERGYVSTAYAIAEQDNPVLVLGALSWCGDRLMKEVYQSV